MFLPVVKKFIILPVIICCDQGEGGEESEQGRQLSMDEEPSQEAAGTHAFTHLRGHMCTSVWSTRLLPYEREQS